MTNNIITILLVGAIVWVCYVKYQEYQYKTLQLMSKNHLLEIENQKMRTKIRYLQNYKTDVSKTFKILNNELSLIKENLPENSVNILTPQIFNSLMSSEPETPRANANVANVNSHVANVANVANVGNANIANVGNADIFSTLLNRFLSQPVSVSIEAQAVQEPTPQQVTPTPQSPPVRVQEPTPTMQESTPPILTVQEPTLTVQEPTPVSRPVHIQEPNVPSIRLQLVENEPENEDALTFDQSHIIERLQNEYSKYLM
jgi:hypothetical protein